MSAIIVYFSRAGENYISGALKNLTVGNTQTAAEILHELTGADMFRIEPVTPYSDSYNDCIEQAKQDKQNNARPAIKAFPKSLDGYDTVYLGYPNYWGTMPMCVFTFLGQHRTINGLRLCRTLACIFSVISHKNVLTGVSPPVGEVSRSDRGADRQTSPPAPFLYNLTKNLTAQSHDNNYAVLP